MKFKLLPQWRIINEFIDNPNISDKEVKQIISCVMSDIRWDIRMLIMARKYCNYLQEQLNLISNSAKNWEDLTEEEKKEWLED